MFVYVVASLGAARMIKREDAGDVVLADGLDVVVPDYRILLADGTQILVEVKNCHARSPSGGRTFKEDYLRRLHAYGDLCSLPAYVAVYWSAWRMWSLHRVDDLLANLDRGRLRLSFVLAIPRSEMRLLGDATLATEHPLLLRFVVSSRRLSTTGKTSEHMMRIDAVEMEVNGRPINAARDKDIAWGFMMHGRWPDSEPIAAMEGDSVSAIEFTFVPESPDPSVSFAMVAPLSSLASSSFNDLTVNEDKVARLRPAALPTPPYPNPTEQYFGEDLPLWRFILRASPWNSSRGAG